MRVLVTGGTGLVGQAIQAVDEKSRDKYFASRRDADLRDWEQTCALFNRIKPERVIHLAARVGGLFANSADQIGFFEDNLLINLNVVKACHQFRVTSAVFCLSTCVFPAVEGDRVLNESDLHGGPPHPSNEGYAYSKRMLECQVRYYREAYHYDWTCVIPTNVYGRFDNFNLTGGHVIPALIHKCWLAIQEDQPFVVSGSGRPLRQFILADDLAKLILEFAGSGRAGTYICCDNPDTEVSIGDVARMVADAFGYTGDIQFDSAKADGVFRKTASNANLRTLPGLESFQFTDLRKGIQTTVDWFLANVKQNSIRM